MCGQIKRRAQTGIDPVPEAMVDKYVPYNLITHMVDIRKNYGQAHLRDEPNLHIRKNK